MIGFPAYKVVIGAPSATITSEKLLPRRSNSFNPVHELRSKGLVYTPDQLHKYNFSSILLPVKDIKVSPSKSTLL